MTVFAFEQAWHDHHVDRIRRAVDAQRGPCLLVPAERRVWSALAQNAMDALNYTRPKG